MAGRRDLPGASRSAPARLSSIGSNRCRAARARSLVKRSVTNGGGTYSSTSGSVSTSYSVAPLCLRRPRAGGAVRALLRRLREVTTPSSGAVSIEVVREDGRWFVSPVTTVLNGLDAAIQHVDQRTVYSVLGLAYQLPPDGTITLNQPFSVPARPASSAARCSPSTARGPEGRRRVRAATTQTHCRTREICTRRTAGRGLRRLLDCRAKPTSSVRVTATLPSTGSYRLVVTSGPVPKPTRRSRCGTRRRTEGVAEVVASNSDSGSCSHLRLFGEQICSSYSTTTRRRITYPPATTRRRPRVVVRGHERHARTASELRRHGVPGGRNADASTRVDPPRARFERSSRRSAVGRSYERSDRVGELSSATPNRFDRAVTSSAPAGADALVWSAARRSSRRRSCTGSRRGDGSGLRGHALIDAIVAVGRHFPGHVGGAAHGALVSRARARCARAGSRPALRGAGSRAARVVAVGGARRRVGRVVAFGRLVGFAHLGAGAWLALAGAVALVVGSWFVAPSRAARRPIGQNGRPGPVAQWSEQGTHNPSVEGSIPSRPTLSTSDKRHSGGSRMTAGTARWSPFGHRLITDAGARQRRARSRPGSASSARCAPSRGRRRR